MSSAGPAKSTPFQYGLKTLLKFALCVAVVMFVFLSLGQEGRDVLCLDCGMIATRYEMPWQWTSNRSETECSKFLSRHYGVRCPDHRWEIVHQDPIPEKRYRSRLPGPAGYAHAVVQKHWSDPQRGLSALLEQASKEHPEDVRALIAILLDPNGSLHAVGVSPGQDWWALPWPLAEAIMERHVEIMADPDRLTILLEEEFARRGTIPWPRIREGVLLLRGRE